MRIESILKAGDEPRCRRLRCGTDMTGPKIFISPESRAYFGPGVVDFVEKNAQLQPHNLNIVTDADVRPIEAIGTPVDIAAFNARQERLKQQFADAGQADIFDTVMKGIYNGKIEHSVADGYRQSGVTPPGGPPPKSYVIPISTIDDPKEMFSDLSGVPQDQLQNVPGTTQDWRAVVLMHESSHNRHDHYLKNTSDVGAERVGDKDAFALYDQAHAEGLVSSAAVPSAMASARAMRYMRTSIDNADYDRRYALAAVDTVDTSSSQAITNQAYQVEAAKMKVLVKIGDSTLSEDTRLRERVTGLMNVFDEADLPPAINQFIDSGQKSDPTAPIPDEVRTAIQQMTLTPEQEREVTRVATWSMDRMAAAEGETLAQKDPSLLYKTARELDQQGAFKDSPVQQEFIDNFEKGAETYAPQFYKVPAADAAPNVQALLDRPTILSASSVAPEPGSQRPEMPAPVQKTDYSMA